MTNPFDDTDGRFVVLLNDANQYSLWPAHLDVPPGWAVVHETADRQSCVDHIERNWTDMRPRGLAEALSGQYRD